ncbi:MAG TPA: glycogen synthase GlgA [Candidatus Omnitrophota bacterium]|nr:glycogen synthase GlgA [Candidatus Omnitrophota bacterium]
MKILYASSEIVPFAKTGGLADVAGALPVALSEAGHEVVLVMPKYRQVDEKKFEMEKVFDGLPVKVADRIEYADIYRSRIPNTKVTVYFIANKKYFDRDGLYQERGVDYPDNCERFSFFCRAVMEFIPKTSFFPQVVHCNDWQTALIIAYVKRMYKWSKTATIYSVHNMGYLGLFPKTQIFETGFGWEMFTPDTLEFWDKVALTKAGFVFADAVNTVSDTYAKEIQTKEYGCGLDGLLRSRSADVYGILNGIDYKIWNPETDPKIVKNFGIKSVPLKYENKAALQRINGLPEKDGLPLIGMITRLADQKGFDILAGALEEIMHLKCQMVILGTGDLKYHELLLAEKKKYPKNIGVNLGFDSALAQQIYAGADMFMMPSLYEPCGLGQLISYKYGTIPIVRKTGGLADTVHDYDQKTGKGDGFVFEEYTSAALLGAVKRAIETYKNKRVWMSLVEKVMCYDYSWDASARKYIDLYQKALKKVGVDLEVSSPARKLAAEKMSKQAFLSM